MTNATPFMNIALGTGAFAAEHDQEFKLMDEAAFQSFYRRTAPALRSYIRLICADAALADDLLQESFYRLLRADVKELNEFQTRAYLYKVAISLVSDHWRRLKRERRWSETIVVRNQEPQNLDLTHDMTRVFRQLKPQQQTLLWLAYVEGFDHREIAAVLGMKEKSVRVVLFRARKELGDVLREKDLAPRETS
jgi:RNA polymerase sigma-70 factor (ECF subfamily)